MLGRTGAVHDDLGSPHQATLAVVGEGQAVAGDLEGTHLPEQLEPITADVKHVAKVCFDSQRAFDVDRLATAILDADAFVEAAVDEAAASNTEALLRDASLSLVEEQHRIGTPERRDMAPAAG